jgi:hypothetical protein
MKETDNPLESNPTETTAEIAAIALQVVPVAGGILSSTAMFFLERRKNERLNRFLINLAEDLKQLEERVNSEFVKQEEFRDLTEDIFNKASDTRQQEKLDALRAVFLNSVLSANPKYNDIEEITTLLSNWQSRHIILLKILYDPIAADERRGNVVGEGRGLSTTIMDILHRLLPDWDEDEISRTMQELHDKGLQQMTGLKTMITDKGIHQLKGRITPFGIKVAKYILNPLE